MSTLGGIGVEIREAKIAYELYRVLKNALSMRSKYDDLEYCDLEPEYPVGKRVADLVLMCKTPQGLRPLLVIEVEEKTSYSRKPFRFEPRAQARSYAEQLGSPYYAVTDGFVLSLFKWPEECLGRHEIKLDKRFAMAFLRELAALHQGRIVKLSFPEVENTVELLGKGKVIGSIQHVAYEELVNELGRAPTRDEIMKRVREIWKRVRRRSLQHNESA